MKLQYKNLQIKTNDTSINGFNLFQRDRKKKKQDLWKDIWNVKYK